MELLILFDRDDRLYRFGEMISGKLVVEADHDSTFSEVWITYRWRTHGKGSRDKGVEEKLTLMAERMSFRAGERREFPFRFEAPNGPVTYHGHLLNVDWYLIAQARSGPYGHFKSEQDFLLQACDWTGEVVLGNKEIPREDLPTRSTQVPHASYDLLEVKDGSARSPGLWSKVGGWGWDLLGVLSIFILGAILEKSFEWNSSLAFLVPILAVMLFVGVTLGLKRYAYRRKLKLGEVWVRPAIVYGDSQVYCHVDFTARRGFHLRSIKASISSQERTSSSAGTTTVTDIHILDEKTYTRPFEEDLTEGRWIAFDCALPVGSDAPASFSSANNALEWNVTMKAELKGWPAWQKTIPIIVLP